MAKIGTYENAPSPVSSEDKLIGTDSVNNDATKNFTVQEIADFVIDNIPPSSGWGLLGNEGTNPSTNFIGTTDANDFIVKTNSVERLRFNNTGGMEATSYINVSDGTNSSELGQGFIALSKSGGAAFIYADNITGNRDIQLPDATGTLVATVNGNAPDAAGNVNVTITPTYKVFTAIITQNGASGLYIVELQNTIGTISFVTYGSNPYYYYLLSSNLFTSNKTVVFVGSSVASQPNKLVKAYNTSTSVVEVYGYNSGTIDHTAIQGIPIEIRVYL